MLVSLPVSAQTAAAQCPALQLDNPNPGDGIFPGGYVISGIAFDPSATVGSGYRPRRLFPRFSRRRRPVPGVRDADSGRAVGAFQTEVTIPKVTIASIDFVVYAFESSSSGTTTVAIPVRVGDVPPPRVSPDASPAARISTNCTAVATPVSLAPPLSAEIAITATPGPSWQAHRPPAARRCWRQAVQSSSSPIRAKVTCCRSAATASQASPTTRGRSPVLAWTASSSSWTPAKTAAGCWAPPCPRRVLQARRLPPSRQSSRSPNSAPRGPHIFTAYAHSSVLGVEAIMQVPVFVGAKPTPHATPRLILLRFRYSRC